MTSPLTTAATPSITSGSADLICGMKKTVSNSANNIFEGMSIIRKVGLKNLTSSQDYFPLRRKSSEETDRLREGNRLPWSASLSNPLLQWQLLLPGPPSILSRLTEKVTNGFG